MSAAGIEAPVYDRTARKAHQWTMAALVIAGLILQGVAGAVLLAIAGAVMLGGRFWWPADIVRQLVWRVLEPAGILKRDDVQEDHETRRIARTIGGAGLALAGGPPLGRNSGLGLGAAPPLARLGAAGGRPHLFALVL